MPNNNLGVCLPLNNCPVLKAMANKRHLRLTDRLFLKRSQCARIGKLRCVCCPPLPQPGNIQTRLSGSPIQINDLPRDCGRVQFNQTIQSDYIIGGSEAKIYDSPWLALLKYEKRTLYQYNSSKIL